MAKMEKNKGELVSRENEYLYDIPYMTRAQLEGREPLKTREQKDYMNFIRRQSKILYAIDIKKRSLARRINRNEALEGFLNTIPSDKTRKQYQKAIYDFEEWYSNFDIERPFLSANRQDALRYLRECSMTGMKNHYSKSWFINKVRGLSSLWTYLENTYPDNHFHNIFRSPKVKYSEYDKDSGEYFGKDFVLIAQKEIDIILNELQKHKNNGKVMYLAAKVLVETGMRIGGLRFFDITTKKYDSNYRYYRTVSKGNERYGGVISEALVQELIKAKLPLKQPFKTLVESTLKNNINIIKKKFGMDFSGGAHAFRHFRAVSIYENSKDIKKVQDFLNHSHINTTAVYLNGMGFHIDLGKQIK
jgi:integrase